LNVNSELNSFKNLQGLLQIKIMKFNRIVTILIVIIFQYSLILYGEEIEYLNNQMLAFANENKGKQIGRGECWDLAAEPLNKHGASWDGQFGFGKKIGSGNSSGLKMESGAVLLPGDIIQFTSVKTAWTKTLPGGGFMRGWETLGMPHHTAFISNFDGKSLLTLLHQNVSGKRYIVETTLDISNIKSGTYIIYRPFRLKKSPETDNSSGSELKKK